MAAPDVVERIMGEVPCPPTASSERYAEAKARIVERAARLGRPTPGAPTTLPPTPSADVWDAVYLRLCFVEGLGRLGFEGGGP